MISSDDSQSPRPITATSHQLTVDQINDQWATLQSISDSKVELELPLTLLPSEIKEGQVVSVCISVDSQSTEEEKVETQRLINDLAGEDDGGDFSL